MNMRWRGTYSLDVKYEPGDVVVFLDDQVTYVCVAKSQGIPPYIPDSGFEQLAGFDESLIDGGVF
jgi:hypothetical protein